MDRNREKQYLRKAIMAYAEDNQIAGENMDTLIKFLETSIDGYIFEGNLELLNECLVELVREKQLLMKIRKGRFMHLIKAEENKEPTEGQPVTPEQSLVLFFKADRHLCTRRVVGDELSAFLHFMVERSGHSEEITAAALTEVIRQGRAHVEIYQDPKTLTIVCDW